MKQQAELALADRPVAPSPLRLVAPGHARAAAAAPLQVATIRTLFPALHHVHADRSALRRALALWAARGFTYKEVARRLHLSVKTVETHVSSVLRKLQLSSRHELSRWASDRRLV